STATAVAKLAARITDIKPGTIIPKRAPLFICTARAKLAVALGNLDQLGDLFLAQRSGNELERDRVRHDLVDARDPVRIDRGKRQEFAQGALGGRLGELGERAVGLEPLMGRIDPGDRIA